MTTSPSPGLNWSALEAWWSGIGERPYVADRAHDCFTGMRAGHGFDRIAQIGRQADYILFVLMRY